MAKKLKEDGTEQQPEQTEKSLAEETAKAHEEAEAAAEVSGTPSPAREPDKVKTPIPGTTPDLDVVSLDEAHSLNPNVVVSGTKPDGQGGQTLLDVVDPAVANAAILPKAVNVKPENPSLPPEQKGPPLQEGEVRFRVTADNEPFYHGGPLKKGQVVTMSKEEADLLVQLKAGQIEGGAHPSNAQVEGNDAP